MKIKCIIKRPDEPIGHMTAISVTLENLQKTVEGYIECVTICPPAEEHPGVVVICNEEARLKGLEWNCELDGIDYVGTIIVIGCQGEEFCDIPITFEEYKELLS